MPQFNVNVWADGFGIWHASVPKTEARTEAREARKLIMAELRARGDVGKGFRLRVTHERFTGHGTVVYREA